MSRNTPIGVGIVGAEASLCERERERRAVAFLIVHHELLDADVGDRHDLALRELVENDAVLTVGPEAVDRLAVVQLDQHLGARFLPSR